jgi:uncharacterized membrane protein YsdA (DUF1294 family)
MASYGTRRSSPYLRYGLAGLLMAALGATTLSRYVHLEPLLAWLLAMSAVTFLFYGLDKSWARADGAERIPERVLLGLGLAGGTLGALSGMLLFHHKVSKTSFKLKFALTVFLQVVMIFAWVNRHTLLRRYL